MTHHERVRSYVAKHSRSIDLVSLEVYCIYFEQGRSEDETASILGLDVADVARCVRSFNTFAITGTSKARRRPRSTDPANDNIEDEPGFVYFVQAVEGGPIKIGWSVDPDKRLKELQGGNPKELKLIGIEAGDMQHERELHGRFRDHRMFGEWFMPEPVILEYIATIGSRVV